MTDPDVRGPIDLVVLEFPAESDTSDVRDALFDLVESGTIRLYDLMVVRKETDGSVTELALSADAEDQNTFTVFAGARSGLLGGEDVDEAGRLLEAGTTAALILYENAWSIPFVGAALAAGGNLVARAHISAQDVMNSLDALEGES